MKFRKGINKEIRPLKKFYTFVFVDCLFVSIRKEMETKSCAVYVILGYDVNGIKDILGVWIGETEGKHSIRPLMSRLAKLAEKYGCAIVLIGHMNKNGAGKAGYRGLGSIDITAAAKTEKILSEVVQ